MKLSFLDELKRRSVLRVSAAYLAGSWLLIQVLETLFPIFGASETSVRVVVIVLAIGFIPVVILSWIFEITPSGIQRDEDVERPSITPAGGRSVLDRVVIVLLTLALGYFAVDKFVLDPTRDAEREQALAEQTRLNTLTGAYEDRSIAVLPFVNMSSDQEQEYFSDGIAEEVLNLLSKVSELRVISRSSSFSFKGEALQITEIAHRLNVVHILEGSVRKSGDRVRITAQLIDARTDTHLWSETFDRKLDDVFAIQDEISIQVVENLKIQILGKTPASQRISSEAYGMYLQARYIGHLRQTDNLPLAIQLLNDVIALEPDYVPALSELARVYLQMRNDGVDSYAEIQKTVRKIVARIEDAEPGGTIELGWRAWIAYGWDSNLQLAADLWQRALALDPGNEQTLRPVAPFLTDLGRYDEALLVARYVVNRDPLCTSCFMNLSLIARSAGRYREAEEFLRQAVKLDPNRSGIYWALGSVLLMAGKPDAALAAFDLDRSVSQRMLGRIMALHDLGRFSEFEAEFASYRADAELTENFEGLARIYAWIGDNDAALEWLERLAEQVGQRLPPRLGVGFYDRLMQDPRFDALMEKYHLEMPPYRGIHFEFSLPE